MTAWWIANIVYLAVIVPVVVVLLTLVLRSALEAKRRAEEIAQGAESLRVDLDGLEELDRTPTLARDVGAQLERYSRALDRLHES